MTKENRVYATYEHTVAVMNEHHIDLTSIAQLALACQSKYYPNLTYELAMDALNRVLHKREIQQLVLVGLALDDIAERHQFESQALQEQIQYDDGLFQVDEVIGLAMVQMYGGISQTNYGLIDHEKSGLIGILDTIGKTNDDIVTTFADDIVGALASCTAASLANNHASDAQ